MKKVNFTTKVLTICALWSLYAISTFAQFSLEGQYIPRFELRDGFKRPILENQDPAAFVEHRARLIAGYKSESMGFKMSVQDTRIWGETGQINKSDQLLSTHEAYGEYYASESSTIRVGRQEVAYDGHRLFGTLDWAAQGRSFDAVRYLFQDKKGNQFDAMVAWNQSGYGDGTPEPTKLTGYDYPLTTGGSSSNTRIFNLGLPRAQIMGYYKKSFRQGDAALMLLHDIFNSSAPSDKLYSDLTIGITPNYKSGEVKFGGQFYYTGGEIYNSTLVQNVDLGGYMFNLYVQHTNIPGTPLLGIDYVSGDDETTSKVEGWSPKYGTNHKFYGSMDYFYVGNGHGGLNENSAGLIDIYLQTNFKLNKKSNLLANLHYFSAPEKRTNVTTGKSYDGTLGTEVDLVYEHTLAKGVAIKLGYSQMFGVTHTMKQLKFNNPDQKIAGLQNWAWLMMSFTPKFL